MHLRFFTAGLETIIIQFIQYHTFGVADYLYSKPAVVFSPLRSLHLFEPGVSEVMADLNRERCRGVFFLAGSPVGIVGCVWCWLRVCCARLHFTDTTDYLASLKRKVLSGNVLSVLVLE